MYQFGDTFIEEQDILVLDIKSTYPEYFNSIPLPSIPADYIDETHVSLNPYYPYLNEVTKNYAKLENNLTSKNVLSFIHNNLPDLHKLPFNSTEIRNQEKKSIPSNFKKACIFNSDSPCYVYHHPNLVKLIESEFFGNSDIYRDLLFDYKDIKDPVNLKREFKECTTAQWFVRTFDSVGNKLKGKYFDPKDPGYFIFSCFLSFS